MRDRQRCCMHATFHGRSFSRTLFIWLVWREICIFLPSLLLLLLLILSDIIDSKRLCCCFCYVDCSYVRCFENSFNLPFVHTQTWFHIFCFFSSFIACSMLVLYFFFLINMHNNVESGQFKCTQRFLRRCN